MNTFKDICDLVLSFALYFVRRFMTTLYLKSLENNSAFEVQSFCWFDQYPISNMDISYIISTMKPKYASIGNVITRKMIRHNGGDASVFKWVQIDE